MWSSSCTTAAICSHASSSPSVLTPRSWLTGLRFAIQARVSRIAIGDPLPLEDVEPFAGIGAAPVERPVFITIFPKGGWLRCYVGMSHNAQLYDSPRLLFTVDEAAEHLRCSRRTIERLIARGDLSPVHVASRRRLRIEDLDGYLERGREPAP